MSSLNVGVDINKISAALNFYVAMKRNKTLANAIRLRTPQVNGNSIGVILNRITRSLVGI